MKPQLRRWVVFKACSLFMLQILVESKLSFQCTFDESVRIRSWNQYLIRHKEYVPREIISLNLQVVYQNCCSSYYQPCFVNYLVVFSGDLLRTWDGWRKDQTVLLQLTSKTRELKVVEIGVKLNLMSLKRLHKFQCETGH